MMTLVEIIPVLLRFSLILHCHRERHNYSKWNSAYKGLCIHKSYQKCVCEVRYRKRRGTETSPEWGNFIAWGGIYLYPLRWFLLQLHTALCIRCHSETIASITRKMIPSEIIYIGTIQNVSKQYMHMASNIFCGLAGDMFRNHLNLA